jgi:hypothetical protein
MRIKKYYASYLHIIRVMVITTAYCLSVCVWGRSGQSSPVAWQDLCPAELQLHHHAGPLLACRRRLPVVFAFSAAFSFLLLIFFQAEIWIFFASYSCKARSQKVLTSLWTLNTRNGHFFGVWLSVFFSWISLPRTSEYPIRAISNFDEHVRRYSKGNHRCQRHRR